MEFRDLYDIAVEPDISMAEAFHSSSLAVVFHRQLENASWILLCDRLHDTSLSSVPDTVSWHLTSLGRFSVKLLYAQLSNPLPSPLCATFGRRGFHSKSKSSYGSFSTGACRLRIILPNTMALRMAIVLCVRCWRTPITPSFDARWRCLHGVQCVRHLGWIGIPPRVRSWLHC